MSILSTKIDQESLETEVLIAICRQIGNKWQLKTLSLVIFHLGSLIVKRFSFAAYPVWKCICTNKHSSKYFTHFSAPF